jgi:tetratricopeptide (TPR) repeat protein
MGNTSNNIGFMKEVDPCAAMGKMIEKPHEIEFKAPANDFDPTKELNDLVKEFKKSTTTDPALDIEIELKNKIILGGDLGIIGKEEKLLQKAKANIAKKQYGEALKDLDDLLQINKDHHEGIFLKAMCFVNLVKPLEALEILKYFANNKPHFDLQNNINSLVGKIRTQVIVQIMVLSLFNPNEELTRKLDSLIELDEGYEPYYYIQSMIFSRQKMLNEALDSVVRGLKKLPENQASRLKNMKDILERQLLEKEMSNAVKFIKQGKYKFAQASLNAVDKRFRSNRLFILIWNYTVKLDKASGFFKKKTPLEVPIDGTVSDRYLVQSEIIKNEVDAAVSLIGKRLFIQASPYLDQAELYVFRYPFLHYLRAYCVYHQYLIDFISLKFMNNIDKAVDELKSIKNDAEIAQEDFTIIEAKPLMNEINVMLQLMDGVAKQVQLMKKEVETVNVLIKAFTTIMEEGTAIRDKDHIKKIRTELQRIKKESEQELKKIKSEESKKYLNQVIQATDRNIDGLIPIERQFEEQEQDKKIIEMQSVLFNNFVSDIKNGNIKVTSRWSCESYISDINKKIEFIRSICIYTVNNEAAKKVLNQIISNWESLRKQFEDLKYRNF